MGRGDRKLKRAERGGIIERYLERGLIPGGKIGDCEIIGGGVSWAKQREADFARGQGWDNWTRFLRAKGSPAQITGLFYDAGYSKEGREKRKCATRKIHKEETRTMAPARFLKWGKRAGEKKKIMVKGQAGRVSEGKEERQGWPAACKVTSRPEIRIEKTEFCEGRCLQSNSKKGGGPGIGLGGRVMKEQKGGSRWGVGLNDVKGPT